MKFSVATLLVSLVGSSMTFVNAHSTPNRMEMVVRSTANDCANFGTLPTPPKDAQYFKAPQGLTLKSVTQGLGYQNYTCSDAGKYTSLGGTAKLVNQCGGYNGNYFFQHNPKNKKTIEPVFDFRTEKSHGSNKFVMGQTVKAVETSATDLEWESLKSVQGSFAKKIFQVNTLGGIPPTSCQSGQTIQIGFQAQYWYYG